MRKNIIHQDYYVIELSEIVSKISESNYGQNQIYENIIRIFNKIVNYQYENDTVVERINISKNNSIKRYFDLENCLTIEDIRNAYAYSIYDSNEYFRSLLESYMQMMIINKVDRLPYSSFVHGLDYILENRGYNYLTDTNDMKNKDDICYFMDEDFNVKKIDASSIYCFTNDENK